MRALITVKITVFVYATMVVWIHSLLSWELDANGHLNASAVLPTGKAPSVTIL